MTKNSKCCGQFIADYFLTWKISYEFITRIRQLTRDFVSVECKTKLKSQFKKRVLHIFIFVFISITLGDRLKKMLLWFVPKSVLPMFSSKSFVVSSLIFRSLIHLEFIFIYGVKECSNFIFLYVAVSFTSTIYWRDCLFFHHIVLPPLLQMNRP